MKKILLPLVAAIAILMLPCSAALAQHTVTASWTESSFPACSSATPALTANCGQGWTLTHTAGSSTVITDATPATLPWGTLTFIVPVPANNSAPTWDFTLVGNYLDATGAPQTTGAATCGSTNTAAPCVAGSVPNTVPGPTNFTVTVK